VNIPPATPGSHVEEGKASWYGVPYHGRRASNGEVYDMHQMTAAHRTLPFETMVRVTNLTNGRQAEVRIIDRGPFVEGRILDLSLAGAQAIDMVGMGVAPVRIEVLSGPHPTAGQFTVQIGAFQQQENAARLRQNLERRYQPVFVQPLDSPRGKVYRVWVGRLASETAAKRLADKLQREESVPAPLILRLDQ
jgi:rare lipoprotein A